ncbi:MAG: choice-of-anchor Q domain-containing protein, partial [Planctomycetota bacterium]|nr:choice-of-anchor Q domain-containing protein [Planctomycetota bacterium]
PNRIITNNLFFVPNGATAINGPASMWWSQYKNIIADPQFADLTPGQKDFRLKPTSPCIDAGVTTHPQGNTPIGVPYSSIPISLWDLDGNARPQGKANDIGAYEYVAPLPVPPVEEGGSGGCAGSIAGYSPSPLYFFFGMALLLGLSVTRRI